MLDETALTAAFEIFKLCIQKYIDVASNDRPEQIKENPVAAGNGKDGYMFAGGAAVDNGGTDF